MITKNQFIILFFTILFLSFLSGVFVGRKTKHCMEIIEQRITSDTVEVYKPVAETINGHTKIATYPKNRVVEFDKSKHEKIIKIKHSHKKVIENIKTQTSKNDTLDPSSTTIFISNDTLRFDSLFIAITDTGSCDGIISRHSKISGKIKEKIITNTITNVVNKPVPLLQISGGVQGAFNKNFKSVDIGPSVQISVKQKYSIGYAYMINSLSHNISFQTKLK